MKTELFTTLKRQATKLLAELREEKESIFNHKGNLYRRYTYKYVTKF